MKNSLSVAVWLLTSALAVSFLGHSLADAAPTGGSGKSTSSANQSQSGAVSQEELATQAMRASLLKTKSGSSSDVETGSRSLASRAKNATATKRYPGGGDEDDLQVQPVLPVPTRTYDGSLLGDEAQAE